MQKIKVTTVDKLKRGQSCGVSRFGKIYAVFFSDDGYIGIEGACKHMKAPLVGCKPEGTIITCSRHGWKFDLSDGSCLTESWATLEKYEVVVEDGIVYILVDKG